MMNIENGIPSLESVKECRILVVGDVMLDRYWHGDTQRISPEAPVPVVHIQREENRLGGAANVALNVNTLGAQATLLSMVGNDEPARCLRSLLEKTTIQIELGVDLSMETILKLRVIGRSQQILRIDFEVEPNHEVTASMLERFEAILAMHDVVLFSDYGKGSLVHISRMIELARKMGKPIMVDPKGCDWKRYSGSSIITPNCAELTQVIGEWNDEDQLQKKVELLCKSLDLKALLLTRSENGMTLFQADKVSSVPANTREVADVTGAGDTVIATLAMMVGCGIELEQAMKWANRAGGLTVAKFGTASLSYQELCG